MLSPVFFRTDGSWMRAHAPLARHTGSTNAAVLVLQLEYWFRRKPQGFYKFLAPCEHPLYRPDDSWTEQSGFSPEEFRTAFDRVGTRYSSRQQFREACRQGCPFRGKVYLSYTDRRSNITYYERHHANAAALFGQLGLETVHPAEPTTSNPRNRVGEEPMPQAVTELATVPETELNALQETGKPELPFLQASTNQVSVTSFKKKKPSPEKQKPIATNAPPTLHQTPGAQLVEQARQALQTRGWPPAQAAREAERLVEWYKARHWCTFNGYRVRSLVEAAQHWKPQRPAYQPNGPGKPRQIQPSLPPHKPDRVGAVPARQSPLPNDWQPHVYARLSYLQQLQYTQHLEAHGWRSVRPPAGTPAVVDRWYVPATDTAPNTPRGPKAV